MNVAGSRFEWGHIGSVASVSFAGLMRTHRSWLSSGSQHAVLAGGQEEPASHQPVSKLGPKRKRTLKTPRTKRIHPSGAQKPENKSGDGNSAVSCLCKQLYGKYLAGLARITSASRNSVQWKRMPIGG